MKRYPMPAQFDGAKFALRYGLRNGPGVSDFFSDGRFIYVPDNLPDDPPIFEASTPVVVKTLEERIAALEARVGVI